MRSCVIESFQHIHPYSINIIARILHINDIKTLQKCCNELVQEGILEIKTSQNVILYVLTPFGHRVQYDIIRNNKKRKNKVNVRSIMCKEFQKKETIIQEIEDHILEHCFINTTNNFITIYQIQDILQYKYDLRIIHSAIYRLLFRDKLLKCGPILFSVPDT
jgi:hypothetical protein